MPPPPLSVAIICKNNEGIIGRLLDSVGPLCSEIVAVDSGSTDKTIPMLKAAGARVIRSEWLGYVPTKQKAMDACAQPWILNLDSDESVEPDLAASIRTAIAANEPGVAGYRLNRKIFYAGRFLNHAWQPEWRLRLVRRGQSRWQGVVHEVLEVTPDADGRRGEVRDLVGVLRHDSINSIPEFLAKQIEYGRLMAQTMHAEGKRGSVWKLATSPAGALLKQMVLKQAFRDGWRGWVAASATLMAATAKHATLLDLSRRDAPK